MLRKTYRVWCELVHLSGIECYMAASLGPGEVVEQKFTCEDDALKYRKEVNKYRPGINTSKWLLHTVESIPYYDEEETIL